MDSMDLEVGDGLRIVKILAVRREYEDDDEECLERLRHCV